MNKSEWDEGFETGQEASDDKWDGRIRDKLFRIETQGLDQDQSTIDVLKELLEP